MDTPSKKVKALIRGAGVLLLPLLLFSILQAELKDWALLIYMAADNSLTEISEYDLEEIRNAAFSNKVNVIIEIDRCYPSVETEGVIYIKGEDGLLELKRLGEINTGDPHTLKEFILYSTASFPARHYGLILWGHGKSWEKSKETYPLYRFFANDETNGDRLDISRGELREAIPDSLFDFIIFDGCMMGGIEVLAELVGKTNFVVASPSLVPIQGLPYDSVISFFAEISPDSLSLILKKIVNVYVKMDSVYNTPLSLTVFNLSNLKTELQELKRIFSIIRYRDFSLISEYRRSSFTYNVYNPWNEDSTQPYVDLYNFLEKAGFKRDPQCVVFYNKASDFFSGASGLHIWFPFYPHIFKKGFVNYRLLNFDRVTEWSEVLFSAYPEDSFFNQVPSNLTLKKRSDFIELRWSELVKSKNWYYKVYIQGENTVEFLIPENKLTFSLLPGRYKFFVTLFNPGTLKESPPSHPLELYVDESEINLFPAFIRIDNLPQTCEVLDITGRKVKRVTKKGVFILKNEFYTKKVVVY